MSFVLRIDGRPDASALRRLLREHEGRPSEPVSGPVSASVRIGISRAQASVYRARRIPVGTPDAYSIAGRVLDAGTGILWRSRSQVSQACIARHYTATPYVEIEFFEVCTPEENAHAPTTVARGRT